MDEPPAFREFVAARSQALVRSAWLLTGNEAAAQDLVQAALVRTWQRWDQIENRWALESYVRRVMLSIFLSWRRRKASSEIPIGNVADWHGIADQVSESELRFDVARGLAGLSRGQRAVVVLRFFDDLTEAETARVLQCSVGTVKSQTARALSRLRANPAMRDLFIVRESST